MAAFWPAVLVAQTTNLLINGDFENEPNWGHGVSYDGFYTALITNQIPGWTIEPDHAVTVHICCRYPVIGGTYSVNTDGEGWHGHNANFYQDFGSTVGVSYTLAFDYQCWFVNGTGTNTPMLNVSVVDTVTSALLYNGVYGYASQGAGYHVVTNFYGTGNALRLRVQESPESGINDDEFIVDNFSVTAATAGAPLLTITRTPTNTVAVSWPLPDTGWLLHATTNVVTSGSVWTEIPPPYATNATSLYFVEPTPAGNKFYQLHKP